MARVPQSVTPMDGCEMICVLYNTLFDNPQENNAYVFLSIIIIHASELMSTSMNGPTLWLNPIFFYGAIIDNATENMKTGRV